MCAFKYRQDYRHSFRQAKQETDLTVTFSGVATQEMHLRELSCAGHGDGCRKEPT